jgi:hypothetical protein
MACVVCDKQEIYKVCNICNLPICKECNLTCRAINREINVCVDCSTNYRKKRIKKGINNYHDVYKENNEKQEKQHIETTIKKEWQYLLCKWCKCFVIAPNYKNHEKTKKHIRNVNFFFIINIFFFIIKIF